MRIVVVFLALLLLSGFASAEERFALLIGNKNYEGSALPALTYPDQDVELLKQALIDAGWQDRNIAVVPDADRDTLIKAIQDYAFKLDGNVGFFYFSGHGGSFDGREGLENFLVPVGSGIEFQDELPDYGYSVENILNRLDRSGAKTSFVVIDACRNPLATRAKGSAQKGLKPKEFAGVFTAYATSNGRFAEDDGLYARVLAEEIRVEGRTAEDVFDETSRRVGKDRGVIARPVHYNAMPEPFCFITCPENMEDILWRNAIDTDTAEAYRLYLRRYPEGEHRDRALEALRSLDPLNLREFEGGLSRKQAEAAFVQARFAFEAEDYTLARTRFASACGNGVTDGCLYLGGMYRRGEGGPVDLEKALAAYKIGCDDGGATSCQQLALFIEQGRGTERDLARAFELYKRGCELGSGQACGNAGEFLMFGKGTAQDSKAGMEYFERGCSMGFFGACQLAIGSKLAPPRSVEQ